MSTVEERLEIVDQGFVAFGAGCQGYRVTREACGVLHGYFRKFVEGTPEAELRVQHWGEPNNGSQMLDRTVVLGRLAAHIACLKGHVAVHPDDVLEAIGKLEVGLKSTADPDGPTCTS